MSLADDLLRGARAAANFTGLPERTIYNLAEQGQIPVVRKGRNLYFRKSELEAAFATQACKSGV